MVLKKKKRTAIGKISMEKEYPKITFEQAIDLVTSAKSAEGVRPYIWMHCPYIDIDFQTRFITLTAEVNKNRKARIVPMSAHTVKLLIQLIGKLVICILCLKELNICLTPSK